MNGIETAKAAAKRLADCWRAMIFARSSGEWEIAAEEKQAMGEMIAGIRERFDRDIARSIIETAAHAVLTSL